MKKTSCSVCMLPVSMLGQILLLVVPLYVLSTFHFYVYIAARQF